MESRILIHAPVGKDGRLIALLLDRAGIASCVCADLAALIHELEAGAGAVFVADEAITPEFHRAVGAFVKSQQSWSDLPLIVMSRKGAADVAHHDRYLALGNVSLVERPAQGITLVSAARAALRARERQYAMREADRRKDEFLAMLAHELRNPLAPIRAASDLLRIPMLDRAKIEQSSHVIARQVKHMTALIDDLLDVSRVSRGLVTLENTLLSAGQIVGSAVEQVRPIVDARGHRLVLQMPGADAYVVGDQKRLVQIIVNILNNAAKYTQEGGEITIAMRVDDANVTYAVTDNGIGIAPEVIGHIFDMFAQAKRTPDRAQGGLGIGLALVKDLVALHGGQVTASSEGTGRGSRFTVTLPRAAAPTAASTDERRVQAADTHPGLRIVVVDDNRDAGAMLGLLLETAGHRVTVLQDAATALQYAASTRSDVYLLDIGLPDMDGNELAKRLRHMPQTADAKLIAVTGYGQATDRRQTSDAGFDHHLVKPVDLKDLLPVLTGPA